MHNYFLQKALAPLGGVDPTLLPEGDTDITEVQAAVGSDKGIGRRLAAACKAANYPGQHHI